MTYFEAYPVTPGMGMRESINAMLAHVAYNGREFGYLPSAVHESNYYRLWEDYTSTLSADGNYLKLAPKINDSMALATIVEDLISLCNDYPVYDDEDMLRIEYERLIEMIEECKHHYDGEDIDSHDIARELFEIGAYIEHSEYGANVSEEDFRIAVARVTESD